MRKPKSKDEIDSESMKRFESSFHADFVMLVAVVVVFTVLMALAIWKLIELL